MKASSAVAVRTSWPSRVDSAIPAFLLCEAPLAVFDVAFCLCQMR
jgi:hypothetical protein